MEEADTLLDTDLALKPLLELAESSSTANAGMLRTVVLKAISEPKIFCGFDDIKMVLGEGLKAAGREGEVIARTLDLFSYGTYGDYKQAACDVHPLSDKHLHKLRQLTLLTLVQRSCSGETSTAGCGCVVAYSALARECGFGELVDDTILREVEDLTLSCVYARVVAGQLCQKTKALWISSRQGPPCRPRDVPLSNGGSMLATIQHFHQGRLQNAKGIQNMQSQHVQNQMGNIGRHHMAVLDRAKKAEASSFRGEPDGPNLIGGGGSVRGWPDGDERRTSENMGGGSRSSGRRQTKRSRGGVNGSMDAFSRC